MFTLNSLIGCLLLTLAELVLIKHSVLCESAPAAKPTISQQSTNIGLHEKRINPQCIYKQVHVQMGITWTQLTFMEASVSNVETMFI